jgi:hypothetical protein
VIITRRDGVLTLIDQNEHGRFAGELVDAWGNDAFAPVEPLDAVRAAAARHDEGWAQPDAEPLFNADAARPMHFIEIALEDHIPLYRRGVHAIAADDPYAGLLVGMHWSGLYQSRWGMQDGSAGLNAKHGPATPLQDGVVDEEEQRWIEAKRALWRDHGSRKDFESGLWHNFELLQAWDLLSLYASLSDLRSESAGGEARDVTAVLTDLEPAAGARLIRSVPTAVGGERVDIELRVVEPGLIAVDPYPFSAARLEGSLRARRIDDRRYADAADAAAAIAEAEDVTIAFALVAAA